MKISFVIPAFNEEENIEDAISSIRQSVEKRYDYEILVVDNGSTDQTRDVVEKLGVKVLCQPNATISALRNLGVERTQGDILVFIDADVSLRDSWGENIGPILELLKREPLTITGSTYGLRDNPTWLEKAWFGPILDKKDVHYLNGGHLITTRNLFQAIKGFDPTLETAEDHDFCIRAKKIGASIINNPSLQVIHYGYPQSLKKFFLRERWHGKGNFSPLNKIFSSKVPICSLFISCSLLALVLATICFRNVWFLVLYVIIAGSVCGVSAFLRCGRFGKDMLISIFLYWILFIARSFSFLDVYVEKIYS